MSYPLTRVASNKRATSAMGTASKPWSPEGFGQGRFPIRESRSHEVIREPQSSSWSNNDPRDPPVHTPSRGSRSPPNTLETLPEDDSPSAHRPTSAASELRDQMKDLKGRISNLKLRAQEDNLRRQSLQSLRTPSPFTSAQDWYAEADSYKSGGSPVSADGGVGSKTESPTRKALYEDEEQDLVAPAVVSVERSPEQINIVSPVQSHTAEHFTSPVNSEAPSNLYDDVQDTKPIKPKDNAEQYQAEDNVDEDDLLASYDDTDEQGGDSVYEDAVYEMPVTERHEDRADAFDYENFFLHSAMGTYSSLSRRSSSSSVDSVATTRPNVTDDPEKRISYHLRNSSMDSVSTVASFATAVEDHSDDEGNEQMDQFTQQLPNPPPTASRHAGLNGYMSSRSDSAVNISKANGSPTLPSLRSPTQASYRSSSRGSSPLIGDLSSGLQISKIFSILTESHSHGEPRLALNEEEKQLIYSLTASFHQVCANLQSTTGDQYDRKEWRRRLDDARRLLNGENFEGQLF